MYIAIDDTYSSQQTADSIFLTGSRRTHVAVIFQDEEVESVRGMIKEMLLIVTNETECNATEFHFNEIYNNNRNKSPWNNLKAVEVRDLFECFADLYKKFGWRVFIQTIDDITYEDHPSLNEIATKIDELDLSDRADMSLQILLGKIKFAIKDSPEAITLLIDEGQGRKKAGNKFSLNIFHDWPEKFDARYESSINEPLLQIADFIAFCINRNSHLMLKQKLTDWDKWFINLVATMKLDCDDIHHVMLPVDFNIKDIDSVYQKVRTEKGL